MSKRKQREKHPGLPPLPKESSERCDICGFNMVILDGMYGEYLACSDVGCYGKRPIERKVGLQCPVPGCEGEIVRRIAANVNKWFYICSFYARNRCPSAYWYPPLVSVGSGASTRCDCGSLLVFRAQGEKCADGNVRSDEVTCAKYSAQAGGCNYRRPADGTEVHANMLEL